MPSHIDGHGTVVGRQGAARNTVERKQAGAAFDEREESFRALFETAEAVILVLDTKGRIVRFNPYMEKVSGYRLQEVQGKDWFKTFLKPKDRGSVESLFEKAMQGLETHGNVTPIVAKDGYEVMLDWHGRQLRDSKGNIVGLLAIGHDMTARMQVQEELRNSERKFRALFEQSMDAVHIVAPDGSSIEANQATLDLFGYTADEMRRVKATDLYANPKDREDFLRRMADAKSVQDEVSLRKKDGSVLDCLRTSVARTDQQGNIVAYQTTIRDITGGKQAERALRESEMRFRSLVENTGAGLLITKTDGTILDCNEAALQMFGYNHEELLKTTMHQRYMRDEDRTAAITQFERDGFFKALEVEMRRRDGSSFHAQLTAARVPLRGETVMMTEMLDITVRQRAREQLEKSHARLEQVVQGTLEVIQRMSEARDPYTSGHQRRVAELSVAIARQMGLPEESCVSLIHTAALIHDIGKIVVPAEILSKPGRLSEVEFSLMKGHSQAGYDILKQSELPAPVPEVVLQHHERLDGSGYPQGLQGDDIFPEAQIIAVADVVEAMSSHRPYRPALGIDAALEEVSSGRGVKYDADVVDACLILFKEQAFAFSS